MVDGLDNTSPSLLHLHSTCTQLILARVSPWLSQVEEASAGSSVPVEARGGMPDALREPLTPTGTLCLSDGLHCGERKGPLLILVHLRIPCRTQSLMKASQHLTATLIAGAISRKDDKKATFSVSSIQVRATSMGCASPRLCAAELEGSSKLSSTSLERFLAGDLL